jgi:hypothetical protein
VRQDTVVLLRLVFACDAPASNTLQEGFLNCLRQFQENKALRRIEVVFAALVYDPEISVSFGAFVRQHTIDLVQLEGRRVAIVVDTDGEPDAIFFLFHAPNPDIAFA